MKWCKNWRLNLNPDKCFFIQYDPKSLSKTALYFINNHPFQRQKEGKDLGITITEYLEFHKQVDKYVLKQINKLTEYEEVLGQEVQDLCQICSYYMLDLIWNTASRLGTRNIQETCARLKNLKIK